MQTNTTATEPLAVPTPQSDMPHAKKRRTAQPRGRRNAHTEEKGAGVTHAAPAIAGSTPVVTATVPKPVQVRKRRTAPRAATLTKPVEPAQEVVAASASPRKQIRRGAEVGEEAQLRTKKQAFALTRPDMALLERLKASARAVGYPARKSDLVRAGLSALAALPVGQLVRALEELPARPSKRPK
jgi:hypothetical protein